MSFQANPKSFDLGEEEIIWARPDEELTIYGDFGYDVTTAVFEFIYGEKKWPYMGATYNLVAEDSITTGFIIEDNTNLPIVANSRVRLVIDEATITSWTDKHLDIRLKVTMDGRTWIAANRTLTVAIGE